MRTRERTGRERQCSRRADERAEEEGGRDAKSAVVCCVSPLGSFSSFLLFSRCLDPFVASLESLGLLLYALPRLGLALTLEFALYTVANACVWLSHSRWCVLLLSFTPHPCPPFPSDPRCLESAFSALGVSCICSTSGVCDGCGGVSTGRSVSALRRRERRGVEFFFFFPSRGYVCSPWFLFPFLLHALLVLVSVTFSLVYGVLLFFSVRERFLYL
jgi:hypothetical protein